MNFLLAFVFSFSSLEAQETLSIDETYELVQKVDWPKHYIGKIQLFSYGSTESCVYRNDDIIFIENYCYPKKNYPARSFALISHRFGYLEFYEEEGLIEARSISLNTFAGDLALDFPKNFKNLSKEDINRLLEANYHRYLRACWASVRIKPKKQKSFSCYQSNPHDHADWLRDAAFRTFIKERWDSTYQQFIQLLKLK